MPPAAHTESVVTTCHNVTHLAREGPLLIVRDPDVGASFESHSAGAWRRERVLGPLPYLLVVREGREGAGVVSGIRALRAVCVAGWSVATLGRVSLLGALGPRSTGVSATEADRGRPMADHQRAAGDTCIGGFHSIAPAMQASDRGAGAHHQSCGR